MEDVMSTEEAVTQEAAVAPVQPPAQATWLRLTLQGLWLVAAPGVAAVVALQTLLPDAFEARGGGLSGFFAEVVRRQPLGALLALFLIFVAVMRYWGRYVPAIGRALAPIDADGQKRSRGSLSSILIVGAVLIATLVFRQSVFTPYRVASSSMLPNLFVNDWIGADRLAYGLKLPGIYHRFGQTVPKRGDVIAFTTPKSLAGEQLPDQLVKRVIGLPGDHVAVRNGRPIINGWPVPACDVGPYAYVTGKESVIGRLVVEFLEGQPYLVVLFAAGEPFEPYEVKSGEVFVLGDNRNNSSDSRAWNEHAGGGLPLHAIEGRVSTVLVRPKLNGALGKDSFFRPLLDSVKVQGIDTRELESALAKCLQAPPQETTPPAYTPNATVAL